MDGFWNRGEVWNVVPEHFEVVLRVLVHLGEAYDVLAIYFLSVQDDDEEDDDHQPDSGGHPDEPAHVALGEGGLEVLNCFTVLLAALLQHLDPLLNGEDGLLVRAAVVVLVAVDGLRLVGALVGLTHDAVLVRVLALAVAATGAAGFGAAFAGFVGLRGGLAAAGLDDLVVGGAPEAPVGADRLAGASCLGFLAEVRGALGVRGAVVGKGDDQQGAKRQTELLHDGLLVASCIRVVVQFFNLNPTL